MLFSGATGSKMDGDTFYQLRRSDLLDLFPEEFVLRKKVADFLEDVVSTCVYLSVLGLISWLGIKKYQENPQTAF